jgi:hypothetical protein
VKYHLFTIILLVATTTAIAQKVVINEIMYAPKSPEPEWVELYNPGSQTIIVSNWKFSDASKTTTLPPFRIEANGFAVLTKDSTALKTKYPSLTGTIAQFSLQSLNNTGDSLTLVDSLGNIIDTVFYLPNWGGTGGISLERIDADDISIKDNFASSIDSFGATPNLPNSVRKRDADLIVTGIARSNFSSDDLVLNAHIKNNGKKDIPSATIKLFQSGNTIPLSQVHLISTLSPKEEVDVELIWQKADYGYDTLVLTADAAGDEIRANDTLQKVILFPAPPEAITINEIMPSPQSSSCEWVEYFNASEHRVLLGGMLLGTTLPSGSTKYFPLKTVNIEPRTYFVISVNDKIVSQYPSLSGKNNLVILGKNDLGLGENEGIVMLENPDTTLIDSIHYFSSWHYDALSSKVGISLERRHLDLPAYDKKNWGSSLADAGATPLAPNSLSADSTTNVSSIDVSAKPNPFSPDGDGFDDETLITVSIPSSQEELITLKVYDLQGRLVSTIAQDKRIFQSADIQFSGKDDNGRTMPIGLYTLVANSSNPGLSGKKIGLVIAKKKQ